MCSRQLSFTPRVLFRNDADQHKQRTSTSTGAVHHRSKSSHVFELRPRGPVVRRIDRRAAGVLLRAGMVNVKSISLLGCFLLAGCASVAATSPDRQIETHIRTLSAEVEKHTGELDTGVRVRWILDEGLAQLALRGIARASRLRIRLPSTGWAPS